MLFNSSPMPEYSSKEQMEHFKNQIKNTISEIINNKSGFDLTQLCISAGKHCWIINVDIFVSILNYLSLASNSLA